MLIRHVFANYLALVLAVLFSTISASTGGIVQVRDFGPNPTNVSMYIYVPQTLTAKPPILVVPHWCHGDANSCFKGRTFHTFAETYGFVVIYPDSPNQVDKCWDVSSNQSLTHEGGGDALGIVSMVRYALQKYNGDKDRVFVTGTSSGAMMTNVLVGSYPDVFAAGSAWAGVAFGCFAGNGYDIWSDACATGKIIKNGTEWANIVKAAYPGYTGFRPKMQVLHGTADTVLNPQNLQEEIKEWTAMLGLSQNPASTTSNTPLQNWTRYRYGPTFEAYEAKGVTHDIPNQDSLVISWFDLSCTGENCFSRASNGSGSGKR